MKAKSEAPDALTDFIHESGVLAWLVVDNAPEQNHARWNKIQREFQTLQTNTEPYSPWQNRAEGEIRELKKMIKRLTLRCNSKRLWYFAGELAAAIRRLTASDPGCPIRKSLACAEPDNHLILSSLTRLAIQRMEPTLSDPIHICTQLYDHKPVVLNRRHIR